MPQLMIGTTKGKYQVGVIAHDTHALGAEPVELLIVSLQIKHGEEPDVTTYTDLDIYRADGQPLIDEELLPWSDYGERRETDEANHIADTIAAELQIREYAYGAGRGWQDYASTWHNPSKLTISIASGKDI